MITFSKFTVDGPSMASTANLPLPLTANFLNSLFHQFCLANRFLLISKFAVANGSLLFSKFAVKVMASLLLMPHLALTVNLLNVITKSIVCPYGNYSGAGFW